MRKIALCMVLILMLSACSSIQVNYDYEKTADFETYKTYDYYSDMNTGLSELDTRRFLNAMDTALQSRGYTLSATPDFLIDIKSSEYQDVQSNNVGVGVGGTGSNVGGGISLGIPIGMNKLNRELIIDFVDENKNGLFWQAVTQSNYNPNASPEKREAQFQAIVAKVLEGFPPEKQN